MNTGSQPEAKYIYLMRVKAIADDENMSANVKVYELNRLRWRCMAQNSFYSPIFREVDKAIGDAIAGLPAGTEDAREAELYGVFES